LLGLLTERHSDGEEKRKGECEKLSHESELLFNGKLAWDRVPETAMRTVGLAPVGPVAAAPSSALGPRVRGGAAGPLSVRDETPRGEKSRKRSSLHRYVAASAHAWWPVPITASLDDHQGAAHTEYPQIISGFAAGFSLKDPGFGLVGRGDVLDSRS
jgi:hypothetical protein